MAAVTISTLTGEQRTTLSATANTCQEFILPTWAESVYIENAATGVLSHSLTGTDATLNGIGANYATIEAGGARNRVIVKTLDYDNPVSLFVSSSASAPSIYIQCADSP